MQNQGTLHDCGNPEVQTQPSSNGADAQGQLASGAPAPETVYLSVGSPDLCPDALVTAEANSVMDSSGAPLSNTAPANYNTSLNGTKLLRFGVDSLYLSYPGQLASEWDQRLTGLKLAAQSQEETQEAKAQVKLGEHLFEVKGKGGQRFSFVLVDNCFHIQLSGYNSTALPLAYVQLSSELLTTLSVQEAVNILSPLIRTFGLVKGEPQISRVDLFVDFTSPIPMNSWDPSAWVTRAHTISSYSLRRRFSGWSIGMGGVMGARLYNKTLELEKSKKEYLKPLWKLAGWDEESPVCRLEFQYKREALKELGVLEIEDLLQHCGGLWNYAANDWLRLTVPNADDSNQTRWANHPLWTDLAAVDWQARQTSPLTRIRKERVPSEESFFVNGLGGLTSFMASQGITELDEGFGEFLAHAERFHEHKSRKQGKGLRRYIQEKVSAKARKYNTLDNRDQKQLEKEAQELKQAYRKARDGD
ncbi:MAG: hypothetical protein ACXW00_06455 [Methylobacter sp.]